jgi:hypothetical protein
MRLGDIILTLDLSPWSQELAQSLCALNVTIISDVPVVVVE